MSIQCMAYVQKYSPYKLGTFIVHLMVADSVNEQYHYEFWMSAGNLAKKCRLTRQKVTTALAQLEADGYLERLSEVQRGKAVRYRFLMPHTEPVYIPDTPEPVKKTTPKDENIDAPVGKIIQPVKKTDTIQKEPKLTQQIQPNVAARPRNPIFDALCEACGMNPYDISKSEGAMVGKSAAELNHLSPPPTKEEVLARARNWGRVFPGATITPPAIVKWWGRLAGNSASPKQWAEGDLDRGHREFMEGLENGEISLIEGSDDGAGEATVRSLPDGGHAVADGRDLRE